MKTWYNLNKNRILSFITCFVMVFVFSFNGLIARAENLTFSLGHEEPYAGQYGGYIELLAKNSSGVYNPFILFWYTNPSADNYDNIIPQVNITLGSSAISFNCSSNMVLYYTTTGAGTDLVVSYSQSASFSKSGWTFVSCHAYGNAVLNNPSLFGQWSQEFTILYGSDACITNALDELYSELLSQGVSLDSINSRLQQILNYNISIDSTLKELFAFHQEVFASSTEDNDKVNNFTSDSDSQSSELDSLNQTMEEEQNRTDIDSASSEVDANLDLDAVGSYGTLLSSFTNNQYVVQILLATLSVALISYVFFGKR